MPEQAPSNRPPPGKRAFFVGFGLGAFAVLVTVGLIVASVRSAVPEEDAELAPPPDPPPDAEDVVADVKDTCGTVDAVVERYTDTDIVRWKPGREGVPPQDSAVESGATEPETHGRVGDSCEWSVTPSQAGQPALGTVSFEFSAFLENSFEQTARQSATSFYDEQKSDLRGASEDVEQVVNNPDGAAAVDDAYAQHTEPGDGVATFALIAQVETAVFVIRISNDEAEDQTQQQNENSDAARDIVEEVGPYLEETIAR